jgi:hypothetical protein
MFRKGNMFRPAKPAGATPGSALIGLFAYLIIVKKFFQIGTQDALGQYPPNPKGESNHES